MLDEPCNKLQDLGYRDSVLTIISNEAHLHFLISVLVVFGDFETDLLNDLPLIVVEVDEVISGGGRVHELEEFDCASGGIDRQIEDAEVGAAQKVEHVFIFLLTSEAHSLRLEVESKLVPDLTGERAQIVITEKHPKLSLEPDWAEERLVIGQDLCQESLPGDGLVLEESLEEHSDFKFGAALHEFPDEEAQVARDVVCPEHVDRKSDDIDGLHIRVRVED